MKAPVAQQRRLLDLADADAELARLRHHGKHLPEDGELAELAEQLDTARADADKATQAVADIDEVCRRIEAELTGMSEHAARDQAALDSGALGHKALAEMQHEMAGLLRRRDVLENELLEAMEQQEALGAERDRAEATVTQLVDKIADTEQRRAGALDALTAKIDDGETSRDALASELPTDLTLIYTRLRGQGKVGAGLVRQRRCGACRIELDPRTLGRIAAAAEDDVLTCEECGAIMVRTEQSGLS